MTIDKRLKPAILGLIAILIILVLWVTFKGSSQDTQAKPTLPVVMVKSPVLAPSVSYVTQTGTTIAYNSVDLVARVEGYLEGIKFTDGSFVKKDSELFVIQPQPYLEQLKAAQATLAAKKAHYAYTQAEYARQKRMYKENATSLNNVEQWLAQNDEAQADVNAAIANEILAQINYGYTHVNAPFDGRIGRHLVDLNNLVGHGSATKLATIEEIDKLYVYFNLNELDVLKLRKAAREYGLKPKDIMKIMVDVKLQSDATFNHKARLDFVNTGLNASTGTMELRALLDNTDYYFVPGLFVQVRIPVTKPTKLLTIPDAAILYDQIGPYLLVVDDKQTVVLKRIDLGSLDNGQRAITKGLNAKDRVIVDGLQNANIGTTVEARQAS